MAEPISNLGLMAAGTLIDFFSEEEAGEQKAQAAKLSAAAQSQSMLEAAQTTREEADLVLETRIPVLADAEAQLYNATIAEQNATLTRAAAAELERRTREQGQKALGSIRARAGASGLAVSGSVQDVLAESAVNVELDALTVRHAGLLQARVYDQEAALGRFSAAQAPRSVAAIERRASNMLASADRQDLAALRVAATGGQAAAAARSAAAGRATSALIHGTEDIVERKAKERPTSALMRGANDILRKTS